MEPYNEYHSSPKQTNWSLTNKRFLNDPHNIVKHLTSKKNKVLQHWD